MDLLSTIKRLAFRHDLVFTLKAQEEMDADDITKDDVIEAIVNAHRIDKVLRSRSPLRRSASDRLYVIKGMTLDNVVIYTKGKIVRELNRMVFYVLISCKKAM
ncbi:MAG: hypothetical protein NTU53_01855 [Planctomycetota bacterium]|nr:hypothetical protein [Planctomycetota bacterium]